MVEGKPLKDLLQLSGVRIKFIRPLSQMERKVKPEGKQVFKTLSEEEKKHLEQLTSLFGRRL
jgi:hypothetical protein